MDADLVAIDLFHSAENFIEGELMEAHLLKGHNLLGSVEITLLRGKIAFRRDPRGSVVQNHG